VIFSPTEICHLARLGKAFYSGRKLFIKCPDCGQFVQVNKFLFGSLHLCVEKC
jgi:hypothetical protein